MLSIQVLGIRYKVSRGTVVHTEVSYPAAIVASHLAFGDNGRLGHERPQPRVTSVTSGFLRSSARFFLAKQDAATATITIAHSKTIRQLREPVDVGEDRPKRRGGGRQETPRRG